ncbi:GntR family transcriptional regulator [Pokkaliibacter plantistimulans]|uniref:GntR family transcriptional regulator n=1 Tax=Proteobacteria bacterium 228 TaxID=2083153 RepID=A0A2S5KJN6_9PROT|nr:GntR family transcriptional regulator [Pokkaliibacter plantistimulans]PPC74998.1 GntR family transcriptional regulator [Pokkaliibacter plantistimulans]
MLSALDPTNRLPKGLQIFQHLRQAIVTLKFKPGQSLSEKEISLQLGVSRQPVREAFIMLSEAGLVDIMPQRGTLVIKISLEAVKTARFIRETLEVAVAKEACGKLNGAFFLRTRALIAQQKMAAEAEDFEEFLSLDEAFHKSIALEIGMQRVWELVESQKAQMDRVRFLSLPGASPMRKLIAQHEAILDALEKGDKSACEEAVKQHLSEVLSVLEPLSLAFPDYFSE